MRTSRSTIAAVSALAILRSLSLWGVATLLIELRRQFEALEPVSPEVIEEFAQLGHSLWPGAIKAAGSVAPLVQQAGVAQHRDVLGDCRAGDVEARGDLSGAQL